MQLVIEAKKNTIKKHFDTIKAINSKYNHEKPYCKINKQNPQYRQNR